MPSMTVPMLLIGNAIAMLLYHWILPRFMVTGQDQRQLKDLPKIHRLMMLIIFACCVFLVLLAIFELNIELFGLPTVLLFLLFIMGLEKKYLPHTRRHLVTLCIFGFYCIWFSAYAGLIYL
ncbi:hypothetical protein [Saccharibacillus sp. JS10]|uniref:hypothetical protein n=1 Tax=Saccharibacillus sp. JS10 TaxID=2950552 RepID=UPI00210B2437|nr:hypothetical protein [Saccharibacillus sp. JS10]MCQ4086564.1 hypothetical protein [Saccharibacillus sp. JS10]